MKNKSVQVACGIILVIIFFICCACSIPIIYFFYQSNPSSNSNGFTHIQKSFAVDYGGSQNSDGEVTGFMLDQNRDRILVGFEKLEDPNCTLFSGTCTMIHRFNIYDLNLSFVSTLGEFTTEESAYGNVFWEYDKTNGNVVYSILHSGEMTSYSLDKSFTKKPTSFIRSGKNIIDNVNPKLNNKDFKVTQSYTEIGKDGNYTLSKKIEDTNGLLFTCSEGSPYVTNYYRYEYNLDKNIYLEKKFVCEDNAIIPPDFNMITKDDGIVFLQDQTIELYKRT